MLQTSRLMNAKNDYVKNKLISKTEYSSVTQCLEAFLFIFHLLSLKICQCHSDKSQIYIFVFNKRKLCCLTEKNEIVTDLHCKVTEIAAL